LTIFAALFKIGMYKVKEIYYTIQGEGFHSGRAAVFCRFSGCNLWSGREEDRSDAVCRFCDTNFWGTDGINGGKYSVEDLVRKIDELYDGGGQDKFVVLTGGEPALQVDEVLVDALHDAGYEVGIETNGTKKLPRAIDWVCVSPKANTEIVVTSGHELKIVIPQDNMDPQSFVDMDFAHRYVQAMESEDWQSNIDHAVDFVKKNPQWRLSVQTHKNLGID